MIVMGFLDWLKELLNNGKKNATILCMDLKKKVGGAEPLEVGLYYKKNPVKYKNLKFNINGRDYVRKTDDDGIARLNINLPVGEYKVKVYFDGDDEYNSNNSVLYVKVLSDQKFTRMEGTDVNMNKGDGTKYQCAVYDEFNNRINCDVNITLNGRTYIRGTDSEGLAKLNLNLPEGDYIINSEFIGNNNYKPSSVTNTLHINPPKTDNTHYGYWVFGRDMTSVNLQNLKEKGVTDLFLNYYAFTTHGVDKVKNWIKEADNHNIHVHVWMQCFYDGEWHNPVYTDFSSRINEAKEYSLIDGVYGVHLDYLRYPGNAYKTDGGTEAVTDFTRRVREAVGGKFLSCAVMPESDSSYYYGQDIYELGKICNVVLPMQYKGNYGAGSSWLASTTKEFSSKCTVWSGLQTYKSDDDTTLLSENELKNDINTCLNNGAKGAILFRYGLSEDIKF